MDMQNQQCALLSISDKANAKSSEWTQLESGEDAIYFRYGNHPSYRQTIVSLASAENITWWKGIEIVRKSNNVIVRQIETQDNNHGPNDFDFIISEMDRPENYILYICKAKAFGVHTRMYYLPFEKIYNSRIEFYWQKD